MNLRHKIKGQITLDQLFENKIASEKNESDVDLYFLVDLVHLFRPKHPKKLEIVTISSLILFLKNNTSYKGFFKKYLLSLVQNRKFTNFLSDAGILKNSDFIYEVKNRIFSKLLPLQPQKDTIEYVLNQVFYKNSDIIWVTKIPLEELQELFEIMELTDIYSSSKTNSPLSEIMNTIGLLSQRMSGHAMDSEVLMMTPEYTNLESPFVALEKELYEIFESIRKEGKKYINSKNENLKQVLVLHKQCDEYIDKAFRNSSKFGISLRVNQSLLKIRQQLLRLKLLLPFLVVNEPSEKSKNSINLALKLIKHNCHKNNIRQLIGESTQLLSYEITQHSAKTGERYITESSKEYFSMLKASAGGGIIVGFLCIIKLLFSKIDTSAFGHAFLYSLNYSFGFIVIYLLGFTLATKQPAMTAATITTALEKGMKNKVKDVEKHSSFAHLFARLFRSQFIAFVGNVLIAFPVSLFLIWMADLIFDVNFAVERSSKLLLDLNPIFSPAIFHAAIAGCFLFLSGIISGNIANKNKHNNVYYRIQEHPLLKLSLGKERTSRIANWFEKYWAGIVSNGWFGVFLGSTASIGIFFGLNLDIRHITFASGNFALGLYGKNFVVDGLTIFWSVFGIGVIGFVNFMVSFSLSLGLAFQSRNIPISEVSLLIKSIWSYFKQRPMTFFFPVKN